MLGNRTDVDGDVLRVDSLFELAHLGVLTAAAEETRGLHPEIAHLATKAYSPLKPTARQRGKHTERASEKSRAHAKLAHS